jgi:hypothetical protein
VFGDFQTSTAIARMLRPTVRSRSTMASSMGSASSAFGRPPTRP